ncbi:MAG: gfo/Idh/MocA family oxidoreductase [Planctomycetes bacterium]|nr:gfo/Idh/MocA family oxidoreductase [Planctomycetota bacterium]NOG55308.1 Gfo/Idh/MocA family oxidoreductase [Planctomycetota bacterium]
MGTASTNRPAIAIIGFGKMVELFHLPRLRKAGWNVAAAVDVTESRRACASQMKVPFVCGTVKELLRNGPQVQAALIGTHSAVRRTVTLPLVKQGIHLMIEKPLAASGREGEAICRDCEAAGVLLTVHHNRRWDPDFLNVRKVVASGFLGNVFHVENRYFAAESSYKFGASDYNPEWRLTASSAGGVMLDWGPHYVDQVLTLLSPETAGPVVSVFADVRNVRYGDADDHFMINLVFENGARALIGKTDICPLGPEHKWVVLGDKGSLLGYEPGDVKARNVKGKERSVTTRPRAADLLKNFRLAVEGEKDLLVTGRESLRTVKVFDAAFKSAKTRKSVSVNI